MHTSGYAQNRNMHPRRRCASIDRSIRTNEDSKTYIIVAIRLQSNDLTISIIRVIG